MNLVFAAYCKLISILSCFRPILFAWLLICLFISATPSLWAKPADGAFTLQVGSFPTAQEAEASAADLRAQNLPIEILPAEIHGRGKIYRVRSGNFASIATARAQGERWVAAGWIKSYWVARIERVAPRGITLSSEAAAKPTGTALTSPINILLDEKKMPEMGLGQLLAALDGKWGVRVPEGLSVLSAQIVFPKAGIVKPAIVFMDEAKARQLVAPLGKRRELLHPMEMRFEPGVKSSPGHYGMGFQQAASLAASLRYISGFQDLSFDDRGYLLLGDSIKGGSELARALLQAAVKSNEIFEIEGFDHSDVVVFGALLTAEFNTRENERVLFNRIQLDFADFAALQGDARVLAAFDPGFVFLHELTHGVWKLPDDEKFSGVGECEAYINQIRRELGLPERMRYHFKIRRAAEGKEQGELWFMKPPQTNAERKQYLKMIWDNAKVGSGGFITPGALGKSQVIQNSK